MRQDKINHYPQTSLNKTTDFEEKRKNITVL